MPTRTWTWIVVAVTAAAPGLAAANPAQSFLGWAPDGSFYATTYKTAAGTFGSLCQPSPGGGTHWPEKYGKPEYGLACVSKLAVSAGELSKLVLPPAPARASALGVTLELVREPSGEGVVLAHRGSESQRFTGFDEEGAKLGDVFFQPTGHAAAFYLDSTAGRAVYRVDFRDLLAPPDPPDDKQKGPTQEQRKEVYQLRDEAEDLMKAGKWADAMQSYRKALELDPLEEWLHFGLLQAAARQRARAVMVAEILWLRTRPNGRYEHFLERAWKDRALDGWATDRDLRALLGVTPWARMSEAERLLSRGGKWAQLGRVCGAPLVELELTERDRDSATKAKASPEVEVRARYRLDCPQKSNGYDSDLGKLQRLAAGERFPGTTRPGVAVLELELEKWPAWPKDKRAWVDWCPIKPDAGQPSCFHLRGPGMTRIATFYQEEPVMQPAAAKTKP